MHLLVSAFAPYLLAHFCAFCGFRLCPLWLNKDEIPVSQFISQDLHLVLARHDPDQRRAVYGVRPDAPDTDETIVARPRANWSKRAEGR